MTLWAGELQGHKGLTPTKKSWAARSDTDVAIIFIELKPGSTFQLSPSKFGSSINRMAYYIEGEKLNINDEVISNHSAITLNAESEAIFHNTHATIQTDILILQGKPIKEPVAQHGPFVMNTQSEIKQAFQDYQKTQFGGWPWPKDAMVFPRTKGRFALMNGKETLPPSTNPNNTCSSSHT